MGKEVVYKPIEKFKKIYAGGGLTQPNFIASFYEWLMQNGNPYQISYFTTTGVEGSVTEDFIFIITNINMSVYEDTADYAGSVGLKIKNFSWNLYVLGKNAKNLNINLNFPIIITKSDLLEFTHGAGGSGEGEIYIHGYLIPKNLLKELKL